jgi:transcriptional regulator with XRE-family HTH domain
MQNTTEELTLDQAKQIITELRDRLQKMPDRKSIGYQIRKRRIEAGISQDAMQAAGVVGICNIERLGRSITTRTLKRVADTLGCNAWEIVRDWEESQSACELASISEDSSNAEPNLP